MIQASHPEFDEPRTDSNSEQQLDYLPARMVNEFAYCPRLFYLMHVEGQFAHNQFTTEGETVHQRVDAKTDALPAPTKPSPKPSRQTTLFDLQSEVADESSCDSDAMQVEAFVVQQLGQLQGNDAQTGPDSPEGHAANHKPIHARSVTLASDRLQVIAKLDLIESEGLVATPVDYKRGKPKLADDGTLTAWKPERVQMCLQAIVLRENGFQCDKAVIYFQKTRQRVSIPIDESLLNLTEQVVAKARMTAQQSAPPLPLINSPKCPRCSLSHICLPDETNRCRSIELKKNDTTQVRLPTTPRDDKRPLYLNKQGLYVGKTSEVLQIKQEGRVIQEVRLRELNQVNLFGNIQISNQALQTLLELEVPLVMFSQHGYFHGMLQGTGLKNIQLRREQFRIADDPIRCLQLAKQLVRGKIINQRVLLMRNHISPDANAISELKRQSKLVERASSLETLLGLEGNAARIYFQQFAGMLKPGDSPIDPCNLLGKAPRFAFDFRGRNRRPPRDPVNAMLSLCYTLLSKDLAITAASVGLDPFLGFFHQVRPGKPALALDLMEPFRALIAESTVITAINNRMVYPEHFIEAGRGITMTEPGRKAIFKAYEQRMDQFVTHPLFDYRVSYRRLLEIQTRLLARVVMGELDTYPVFVTR